MQTEEFATLTSAAGDGDDLRVLRRVVGLDVGVDGFLNETLVQLRLTELTPHAWLVALLGELVGAVQVVDVVNQHLVRTGTGFSADTEAKSRLA